MREKFLRAVKSQGFRDSTWNVLNTISYPIAVLATTPFFINKLGENQYGIWVLVNSTTQLMSIFNFGLGDTTIKYISKYRAAADGLSVQKTISLTWALGLATFGLSVISGAAFLLVLKRTNLFDIEPGLMDVAAPVALLAFLLFGLKFLEQIVLSVSQGFRRYDTASKLSLVSRFSILGGNILIVFLGYPLPIVFLSSSFILSLFLVIEIRIIRYMFPALNFRPRFDRAMFRKVYQFGFWSWIQSVLAIVTTQTDKLIVGYFSGLGSLTYYSLGSTITTHLHGVFTSASAWVFPAVSMMSASKNEPLSKFYAKAEGILLTMGFVAITGFLLLEQYILPLWLGEAIYQKSIGFIKIFIYYNLFLLLNIMPYFFLNGSGFVRQNTYAELMTKALNIIGMVTFYLWLGNVGLVWGLVVSMLIATPIRFHFLRSFIVRSQFVWILKPIVTPILLIAAFESGDPLLKVGFLAAACIAFYFFYLNRSFFLFINSRRTE